MYPYSCSKAYSCGYLTAHFHAKLLPSSLMKIIRINLLGYFQKADASTLPRDDYSMWCVIREVTVGELKVLKKSNVVC